MAGSMLPSEFADLEPFAAKWSLPTEHERYATRLASSMDEMHAFYDAAFPRLEDAMAYLDGFPLDGYPFDRMTERYHYQAPVGSNWKIYMDAFQEFYHAPILHSRHRPPDMAKAYADAGFEAPLYKIEGPHRVVSTTGQRPGSVPDEALKPTESIFRSGLFGPWDTPELGELPAGLNPGRADPAQWGLDSFQIWPNFVILIWQPGWYLTYHYWPTSYNTHIFEGTLYFMPPKNASERMAQEVAAVTFKEYGLQDANTLEATQSMLESRVVDRFPLNDQEVLCRHLHHVAAQWVEDYQKEVAG